MSNKPTDNMENPVSQIDLAAWAVVSEPIDTDAVARVKENAKRLATQPSEIEHEKIVEPRSVQQKRDSSRFGSWLIRGGVAAAIAGVVLSTLFLPGDNSAAFAAAIKKLGLVKVFSYDQIVHSENLAAPATSHVIVSEDGRWRSETDSTVSVHDQSGIPRITLLKDSNSALVYDAVDGLMDFDQLAWFRELQSMENETTVDLAEKEIDGLSAFGKEVQINEYRFQIWVNVETEELVMVEQFFPGDSPIEKSVARNFDFTEEADEELFSFEVPEGYTVETVDDDLLRLVDSPEQNVIELMQDHADLADGKFPVSLDVWADWFEVLSADGKVNQKLTGKLGAVLPFLASMKKENYRYLGDGMVLNQDEKAIAFWYRNKEGQLRAIYSDLTVSDIKESDLPESDRKE